MKEQLLQTDDITGQTARVLSYELLSSAAKLITNYKTQVNLAVYTYDVTLLKDLTKFDYFSAYIPKDTKSSDIRVKVIKIDLEKG